MKKYLKIYGAMWIYIFKVLTRTIIHYTYLCSRYIYNLVKQTEIPFLHVELPNIHPLHIYLTILLILLSTFFYIRIVFSFWSMQPVFHSYDYWRYYTTVPFIIQRKMPLTTKYTTLQFASTMPYNSINMEYRQKITDILQCHYIVSDKILFQLKSENLDVHMRGHEIAPLVTLYNIPKYAVDASSNIVREPCPVGVLISTPVYLIYKTEEMREQITAFEWDYICMHREQKKYNITRNMIQCHEYNQRVREPAVSVSIFKKEIDLCPGMVPLTQYNTYTYYLRSPNKVTLPEGYVVDEINHTNYTTMIDFLEGISRTKNKSLFQFMSMPSYANLTALIENKQLFVFCLRSGEQVYGMYILRDDHIFYEDIEDGNAIHLTASICNTAMQKLFYSGFICSLHKLAKIKYKKYRMLLIDECSHNTIIIKYWKSKYSPVFKTPTAYYLYNYVVPNMPIYSEKCFLL